jgi:hypothetical protein
MTLERAHVKRAISAEEEHSSRSRSTSMFSAANAIRISSASWHARLSGRDHETADTGATGEEREDRERAIADRSLARLPVSLGRSILAVPACGRFSLLCIWSAIAGYISKAAADFTESNAAHE